MTLVDADTVRKELSYPNISKAVKVLREVQSINLLDLAVRAKLGEDELRGAITVLQRHDIVKIVNEGRPAFEQFVVFKAREFFKYF